MIIWYTIYDNWIGGCGSAHSHGHLYLFSTICNISCHHPIINYHRWQWPQFFLTSSSYFLQSNSTPSDRFSTLKVSWHANFPQYWAIVQISKEFLLVMLHLEVRSVKDESTPLPLVLKLTVVALGFPSRSFQKKSTNKLNQISSCDVRYRHQLMADQDLPSFWAEALSLSIHSVVNDYTLAVTLQYDKSRTD